jgi:hypothetical protein
MHTEPWEKITVVMLQRHAGSHDVMSVLLPMRHHKYPNRIVGRWFRFGPNDV